jgi:tetrahydromethanopterin S-methyltransferase subunit C
MSPTAAAPATSSKTLAILSVVAGAISILLSWILPIIWILLAIAAIVLGFLSRRRESARGLATAGIVLGFLGLAANIASMVLGAVAAAQYLQM